MKSLRCVCGRDLTAKNGDALLAEVERHLDEVLIHAQLAKQNTGRELGRGKKATAPIVVDTKEER